jgi:hypothetical protein
LRDCKVYLPPGGAPPYDDKGITRNIQSSGEDVE